MCGEGVPTLSTRVHVSFVYHVYSIAVQGRGGEAKSLHTAKSNGELKLLPFSVGLRASLSA